jgi:hypothetical protein
MAVQGMTSEDVTKDTGQPISYAQRFLVGSLLPAVLAIPVAALLIHMWSFCDGTVQRFHPIIVLVFGSLILGLPVGLITMILSALRFRRFAPRSKWTAFLTGMCYLAVLLGISILGAQLVVKAITVGIEP